MIKLAMTQLITLSSGLQTAPRTKKRLRERGRDTLVRKAVGSGTLSQAHVSTKSWPEGGHEPTIVLEMARFRQNGESFLQNLVISGWFGGAVVKMTGNTGGSWKVAEGRDGKNFVMDVVDFRRTPPLPLPHFLAMLEFSGSFWKFLFLPNQCLHET